MAILIAALELNKAAMKAVMVVPILAPRMKGNTDFLFTIFLATRGTTREVVTVLDRIAAVVSTPQTNDFNGLRKKNFLNRSCDPSPKRSVTPLRKNKMEPKR